MKILIASNNLHKIDELRTILKSRLKTIDELQLLSLAEAGFTEKIPETGSTFEENALIKAETAAKTGCISIADDSGLTVDALNGVPGIYSARYAGEPCDDRKNNEKLLCALKTLPPEKRSAKFVCAIALVFPNEKEKFTVRGECPGRILEKYEGTGGFGYDPLFLYEPLNKTFAQLTKEEKNKVSHRAKAMEKLIELFETKLKEYGYEPC